MISRKGFLKVKVPNLPYCHYSKTYGNQFHEAFFVKNTILGIQLNFHWNRAGNVSISKRDLKEKNEHKKMMELFSFSKSATFKDFQSAVNEVCYKYIA